MTYFWDTWDPSYARPSGSGFGGPSTPSRATVNPDVECAAAEWSPRPALPGTRAPEVVLFVDGVQRVDARGWLVDEDGTNHPTMAVSYAAGVVRCDLVSGTSEVAAWQVCRALLTSAPHARPLGSGSAYYRVETVENGGPKALEATLGALRAKLEAVVSQSVGDADLLVADGRLNRALGSPVAVGCAKTHTGDYLSGHPLRTVTGMPAGHRCPVFQLSDLYSWYLRLPGGPGGPWGGMVRVECSGSLTVPAAIALADLCTGVLPRFASNPYKDPRAPQNLMPVAGLERHLRGMLGDGRLLDRMLRRPPVDHPTPTGPGSAEAPGGADGHGATAARLPSARTP